mgnify:CR=1 FL=1
MKLLVGLAGEPNDDIGGNGDLGDTLPDHLNRFGIEVCGIAAAHALEHNRARLADDHANCRALANGLAKLPGLEVDAEGVETNMLFIGTGERDAAALAKRLDESGIRLLATGPHTLRAVTNLTVSAGEIVQVITAFEESP